MKDDSSTVHCYANWEQDQLRIGNALIERIWRWRDNQLWAETFLDKRTGRQWITGAPLAPTLCRANSAAAVVRADELKFTASHIGGGPIELPSLAAELQAGERVFRFKLFDASPSVTMELIEPPASEKQRSAVTVERAATGVEESDAATKSPASADDTLDSFRHAPRHLRLTQVTLIDQTDVHDNLVHETSWLLLTAEANLRLAGNVFLLEDTLTGDGLAYLKLAPLPHARPIPLAADIHAEMGDFRLLGCDYPAVCIAYTGGRFGRIAAIQQYQRQVRPYVSGRDATFLSNTWGDRNKDGRINEAFMRDELKAGVELGVDVIQIDDGWQRGRTANSVVAGGVWSGFWASDDRFWDFHPQRFPGGIAELVNAARASGIRFGLWFGPDSANDFANHQRDADRLLQLHRELGVDYFKLDGIKIHSRDGEANLRKMMELCLKQSSGRIVFDLDVTAETRPGYFGSIASGPIFLENRYTDWSRYWPHVTLRNLWQLSQYIDPLRLRMEFLNNTRNPDKFPGDALAPANYSADYLFASVMFANPLGWFEMSQLPREFVDRVKPLVALRKSIRDALFAGTIYPIGDEPTGASWTGLASIRVDGHGYAVIFRELNTAVAHEFEWPSDMRHPLKVIAGEGRAAWAGDRLKISIPSTLAYALIQL